MSQLARTTAQQSCVEFGSRPRRDGRFNLFCENQQMIRSPANRKRTLQVRFEYWRGLSMDISERWFLVAAATSLAIFFGGVTWLQLIPS